MKNAPQFEYKVVWKPFLLNKNIPEAGWTRNEYMAAKGMGNVDFGPIHKKVGAWAATVGIKMNFCGANERRYAPTLLSHRLLEFAKEKGKQNEVAEEIFISYFEEGKMLNNVEVLTAAAVRAGLDEAEVKKFLEGDEFRDEVLYEAGQWSNQVNGVPHIMISTAASPKKVTFSGGQSPDTLVRLFKKLYFKKKDEDKRQDRRFGDHFKKIATRSVAQMFTNPRT